MAAASVVASSDADVKQAQPNKPNEGTSRLMICTVILICLISAIICFIYLVLNNVSSSPGHQLQSQPASDSGERDPKKMINQNICGTHGSSAPLSKVLNGDVIQDGVFPWLVQMEDTGLCTGAIISSEFLITAAHCITVERAVDSANPSQMVLRLDQTNFKAVHSNDGVQSPHYQERRATLVVTKENAAIKGYNSLQTFHTVDLALYRVSPPFEFNDFIRPVCVTQVNPILEPSKWLCAFAGYGAPVNQRRRILDIRVTNRETDPNCVKFTAHEWHVCANYPQDRDACQGDSGGPLTCVLRSEFENPQTRASTKWHLVGVFSASSTDCIVPVVEPGVFTNISMFQPWIQTVVDKLQLLEQEIVLDRPAGTF